MILALQKHICNTDIRCTFFMIFFQLGVDKPSDLKEEKANV